MNKKAQEEIVGFTLIVVIVAIVGVIILGISLKSTDSFQEGKDIYHFLESAMEVTSSCAISYEPAYSKLGELFEECLNGLSVCTSGEKPCQSVEKALAGIIEASFNVAPEAHIKGYEFQSTYSTNTTLKEILIISKGKCGNTIRGSEVLLPAFPGTISNILKLCY
ncbi:MAG: hypothetical protein Q7S27_06380 [Nanoarchaeota archaeon]|nr:hypothetical protein [Nanoarchaeota archaeon]